MRYRTKVTLILLAVAGISGCLFLWMSHRAASALAFDLIQEKVLSIAVSIAPLIDGDAHDRIKTEEDDGNEDYLKVRKVLREVRDANQSGDFPVAYVYTYRPIDEAGKKWEYVVDAEEDGSEDKSPIGEPVELEEYDDGIFPELANADVDTVFITDSYGTWLSAWAPVRNSAGESVALVGIDVEAKAVKAKLRNLFYTGLATLGLAFVAAAAASIFLSGMVTAPLKALGRQVGLIHDGDLTTRISMDSKDEFGELGEAIHEMADGLQEREAFKEALVRFVSAGKTDSVIEDTESDGDSDAARRVTVLAASLQGLEGVANSLSADKVFGFLSDWYSTMIDIILTHRGSLEKSAGESVTATFGAPLNDPDQERHALEAALTMQQELGGLRRRWEIPEDTTLSIGIAIHTGHVTVSDEDEVHVMEVASLQRIIGALSLIKDAAKTQKDGIVISEAAADGLKGSIPLTYLKSIEVPGTGSMLSLHTVQMPTPS